MVEVYSRPLRERFLAPRCSIAYLFRVCWYMALVLCPLYIAYASSSLWKYQDSYREQPVVSFTKQAVVLARAADGTAVFQYATFEKFNAYTGYEKIRQPIMKSWSSDVNFDGRADSIDVNFVFPLLHSDAGIVSCSLLLFFHAHYNSRVKVDMDAMIGPIHSQSSTTGNKWTMVGELQLRQRNPFNTYGVSTRNVYANPVIAENSISNVEDVQWETLLYSNEARNDSLLFEPRQFWSISPSSVFNISAHVIVPAHDIFYVPSPGEALKFGFIQWLAIFWLLYFVMWFVREFVYAQNVVETKRVKDTTPLAKIHQF